MIKKIESLQIIILSIILALGLIISTKIIISALPSEGISVTGSASKVVKSDNATLTFDIVAKRKTKKIAYESIKQQIPVVKKYLLAKGFEEKDIEIRTTHGYETHRMLPNGNTTNEVEFYNLYQPVVVKSQDVEKIKKLSVEITELMNQGVELDVSSPEYYYSKISDLKIELLKDATTDAKQRASAMLKSTHNRTGKIQSVKMGVFQITSADSTDVSDSGIYDTASVDKKVTAVANVVFKIK